MSRPIRAYLLVRDGLDDWSVSVCRDLEMVLEAWKQRSPPEKSGVLHIGFDRPPSTAFEEVASAHPGRLLITASARFGLPVGYESSNDPVGYVSDIPIYIGIRGWGYQVDKTEIETVTKQEKRRRANIPIGWVADLLLAKPEIQDDFEREGIYDDNTYLVSEQNLEREQRRDLGLFRFRAFVGKDDDDPCLIARASPPWFKERPLDTIGLTVRVSNVFSVQGVKTVGDIENFELFQLLRLPNFGRKSVRDLCATLLNALEEGPFSLAAKIQEAGNDSLYEEIKRTLRTLPNREHEIITRRMGFCRPAETLQAIADDYGITRERIRQVESKVVQHIVKDAYWDDLLTEKLNALLGGREFPLPVLGIEAIDEWFVGVSDWIGALRYILANFCDGKVSIVQIDGIDYFGLMEQLEWEMAQAEAPRLLKYGAEEKWTEEVAKSMIGRLIKESAKEFRGIFFDKASRLGHFIVEEGGTRLLVSFGRGADQVVEAVLSEAESPLHYTEIARRASDRQGRSIDDRRAHNSAAAVGILLGRGTYGVRKHIGYTTLELDEVRAEAERIILSGPAHRQWHSAEILSALLETEAPIGEMSKYILDFLLRESRVLKNLGRMTWVSDDRTSSVAISRIDIRQAIISLLDSAGRPLSSSEIQSRLVAVRGINEIFQIAAIDPLVRLGFGLWGLNDRDVLIKRSDQPAFFDEIEVLLRTKGKGIHISEIENFEFDHGSNFPGSIVFGLACSDARFHVGTGQYIYLSEWGGPRRETLSEATWAVLCEQLKPLTLEEIMSNVEQRLDRLVDRTAVSSRLQSLNAVFDADYRTWTPPVINENQFDEDDFDAEHAVEL
mgnify:CR=1 FL=1